MTTRPSEQQVPDLAPDECDLDDRAITTIRMLAADMVQAARSGHPGLPLGAAVAAYAVWSRYLKHDPDHPQWPDRDRFVLSAGHGSALLYALLHLFGYDLSLDELKNFRQCGSATPGHPEYGHTVGVETTTGPLGQGLGNAVGMALAERMLAARFNTTDARLVDHRTYVLASDGDLMEGISHEAASLAGHLGLGRLIVVWDDNRITIDGRTSISCSDDTLARFQAYGWHVVRVRDGNDLKSVDKAISEAISETHRPSLIAVRTLLGFGAAGVEDTPAAHGAPLGDEELARTKRRFGWPEDPWYVPDAVRAHIKSWTARRQFERQSWEALVTTQRQTRPWLMAEWDRRQAGRLPDSLGRFLPSFREGGSMPTRKASGQTLRSLYEAMPEMVGGSADLAGSTSTDLDVNEIRGQDYGGRIIRFGVREHAMGAIINGIALHGGWRPFGSTFLVFSDYMRPAIRLAALMRLPVIYVFTHDSVAVGEDGPTHQPVEHLASLRSIPNLAVLRPADANETAQAWRVAVERSDGPTALVLSRQALPILPIAPDNPDHTDHQGDQDNQGNAVLTHGAWTVRGGGSAPDVVLIASGSEVSLALRAAEHLAEDGISARVVSAPWRERLLELAPAQREALIPALVPQVAIEAGRRDSWQAVVGPENRVIGIDRFGASGPGPIVMSRLGLTVEAVRDTVYELLSARQHKQGDRRGRVNDES